MLDDCISCHRYLLRIVDEIGAGRFGRWPTGLIAPVRDIIRNANNRPGNKVAVLILPVGIAFKSIVSDLQAGNFPRLQSDARLPANDRIVRDRCVVRPIDKNATAALICR